MQASLKTRAKRARKRAKGLLEKRGVRVLGNSSKDAIESCRSSGLLRQHLSQPIVERIKDKSAASKKCTII
jgi:hypothetical protein